MNTENEKKLVDEAFAGFESQEVSMLPFKQLQEGWHRVAIKMAILTNDFMTGLREPKPKPVDKLPVWKDPTMQIAVYFEGENHIGATRRFSRYGYWKFDDLLKSNPEKAALCTKEGDQGYAVTKDTRVRLISKEATDASMLILNRMLTAAKIPAGTNGTELCPALIGKELQIQVTKHLYNKVEYFDVQNFVTSETPESELERVPTPKDKVEVIPETV